MSLPNEIQPTEEELLWMYEHMVLSRKYEERIGKAYLEGKVPVFNMTKGPIPGEMHLSNGQEPVAVGVCAHLTDKDCIVGSHRPHHIAIAKGVDLDKMTAEIYGREAGLSRGKGGHMHLFDPEKSFSCSGIVGQGIGLAVGQALAAKLQGTGAVAVAVTGEGAANQGLFHESMNLAALWKLPFICIIEDNKWGVSVSKATSTSIARNSDRAAAYGIPGEYVEDNDVWGVYSAAKRAVERARNGEGPTIIEVETIRMAGHFVGDPETYVPKDELAARRDPIDVMGERLEKEGVLKPKERAAIAEKAEQRVEQAVEFACDSPYPDGDEAMQNIFA
ncbi:thiamine pyrophosphate-dependent dehydrogenase E1 component subunit alpha [Emcibacter sp.]|uniref:thiamine pyrophosphate-dependent dehydrogenase E1 component subunit alpha n=1 Tax=Emcibacter sp. TaxID=1979954 RepID=UPI003A91F223